MISLLKQTSFLVTLMDIETKLFLIDLAGNGEYNEPNTIFIACFIPKIWLIV